MSPQTGTKQSGASPIFDAESRFQGTKTLDRMDMDEVPLLVLFVVINDKQPSGLKTEYVMVYLINS